MPTQEKAASSRVVKVTGMSEELLALLDARVRQQHAAGRAEYVRELIRRDVLTTEASREASPGTRLLNEYHALVDLELDGSLSPAQGARLREVEQALDDVDRKDPETRAMFARLEETAGKLDQLLQAVRELPKGASAG